MADTATATTILNAAEHRMRRGGYNAVSFRDLATDAKIKSSSVHYHYPRKKDLGVALVRRYAQTFFAALDAQATGAHTPADKIVAFRRVYRHALTEGGTLCLCGMLGAEAAGLPKDVRAETSAFFAANIAWIAAALPDTLSTAERQSQAARIVATHQGAMMLANSMGDVALFDAATRPEALGL